MRGMTHWSTGNSDQYYCLSWNENQTVPMESPLQVELQDQKSCSCESALYFFMLSVGPMLESLEYVKILSIMVTLEVMKQPITRSWVKIPNDILFLTLNP